MYSEVRARLVLTEDYQHREASTARGCAAQSRTEQDEPDDFCQTHQGSPCCANSVWPRTFKRSL